MCELVAGLVKRDNRAGRLDAERDFLAHTEKEVRVVSDLQEMERHVRRDNELHWRAAERQEHAGPIIKCGRTEQRTAAQKRDNAVLRQYERVLG